jgi:hypothetical protein
MIRSGPLVLVGAMALGLLASGARAQEPFEGADLLVEILDPHHPDNAGKLLSGRLPIRFEGKQPTSLMQLREWLLRRADPRQHADRTVPPIGDRHASNKSLLIRCDQGQIFGWAQAVMLCCSFFPGRAHEIELRTSPLIHKIHLQMGPHGRRINTPLPVNEEITFDPAAEPPVVEIILKVPKESWTRPVHECEVVFMRGDSAQPFGRSHGIAHHSARQGHVSLLLNGGDTLLRLRRYLNSVRERDPNAKARINAYAQTPAVYVFEVLEAMQTAGFQSITYSVIPPGLINDLEAGNLDLRSGLTALLDDVASQQPDPLGARQQLKPLPASTAETVEQGLAWLARHQGEDGSWSSHGFSGRCKASLGDACDGKGRATHDTGVTGLSLLAFLGAGHTPREGSHKDVVRQGLKWLKTQQDPEGCFGPRNVPHSSYNHALATLAMCEAYGMTRSGIWKASAQNAANYVRQMQNPFKAWRYGERSGDNDTSVTAWMVMALKSAKLSGLEVDETSFTWARAFIDEMTDVETGRTGYTQRGERSVRAEGRMEQFPPEHSEALTAMGIMTRVYCGENPRESPMIKAGSELLMKRLPEWEPESGKIDMVYWYFGTLATFQIGGAEWKAWNDAIRGSVLENQRKDGCCAGSWDPAGAWGEDGGRVYATALMTLCSEVSHRYARVFGTRR